MRQLLSLADVTLLLMKSTDTLLRQWCMLRQLPRQPRKIGTAEIRKRMREAGYDVTTRTIQRDLVKLSTVLPLHADESRPKGWAWIADAPQLDMPALEPQAALTFHMVERHLMSLLPASTLNYLTPWFHAATGVLDSQPGALGAWRNKVRILAPGMPMLPPEVDGEIQRVVTQALLSGQRIEVTYRSREARGGKTYEASPLGIVLRDQVLYLICTLREYDDIKQLVLGRIQSARLLDKPARVLPGFDIDAYIEQGEFGFPVQGGKRIALVVDIDREAARSVLERPLDRSQRIEDIDEKIVRLSASIANTAELRRWLLGFGPRAVLQGPASLREEMRAEIAAMHRGYSAA